MSSIVDMLWKSAFPFEYRCAEMYGVEWIDARLFSMFALNGIQSVLDLTEWLAQFLCTYTVISCFLKP